MADALQAFKASMAATVAAGAEPSKADEDAAVQMAADLKRV